MVGIVAGNGLGLWNEQSNGLGAAADSHALGQAGGLANVNVANGNLSIQFLDETLSGMGADMAALRTYNSLGNMARAAQYLDGDQDGWRWVGERRLLQNGTVNQSGSQILRIGDDGHETIYKFVDAGSYYSSTEGDGAHDRIVWNAGSSEYVWTEGSSGTVDRFNSLGLLKNTRDISGNGFDFSFTFNASLNSYQLTTIRDARTLESIEFVYGTSGNGLNKLARIDTRTGGNLLTQQVYYTYDSARRLDSVTTDLTPGDGSIADNKVYKTKYTYADATSYRIAKIEQFSGGLSSSAAQFTYDAAGRIYKVSDYSGITTFTYTTGTTTVKNAAGDTWTYTYNAQSQLTKVESGLVNGVKTSQAFFYDADGNIKTVTDGRSNVTTYGYDANGNRLSDVDAMGNTVTRTYTAANKLLTETRYVSGATGGETARFVYDTSNRLRFTISAEGRVTETQYNANGLLAQTIQYSDASYLQAAFELNDLVTWTAARDRTKTQLTDYQYDVRGNLSKTTSYGKVNSSGQGVIDNATTSTRFVYSAQGQLLQTLAVKATDVQLSSATYDGMGRQLTFTNENGTATTSYLGNTTSVTVTNTLAAVMTTTVTTNDSAGRVTSVATTGDSTTRTTRFTYDLAGRLRIQESPTGARSYVFYEAAGHVSARVDAAGAVTQYTYDADGRVLTETRFANAIDAATLSTWTGSTPVPVMTADAVNDRLTTYTYDAAGRLKTTTVAGGLEMVTNTYDGESRLTQTQQGARVTQYYYDKDSKQIGQLNAEGYLIENVYDKVGRLVQTIRYGTKVTVLDTFANMKLAIAGASLSSYFYYDAAGRMLGAVNELGYLSETVYDEQNSRRQSKQYMAAVTVSGSDTLDSLRSRAGSSQTTTTYFDNYGRVDRVVALEGTLQTDGTTGSVTTRNVYDEAGRLVRQIQAEGTVDERAVRTRYNAFNEVTGAISGVGEATVTQGADLNTAITDYGVTTIIDAMGRKVTEIGVKTNGATPVTPKTFFFYNAAGQLTFTVNALGEVARTTYNTFGQVASVRVYSTRISAAVMAGISAGGSEADIINKVTANDQKDAVVSTTYTKFGAVYQQWDAESNLTTNSYNTYGQLSDSQSPVGATTHYNYDLLGRVIDTTGDFGAGALNAKTSVVYDGYGRVFNSFDANNNKTITDYLDNGRTILVTDPMLKTKRIETDAFGRTVKSYDGSGNGLFTLFSYDDVNRTLSVTTPEGVNITTTKTRTGETLQVKDGRGGLTKYTYSKDGKLLTAKDAKLVVTQTNTYDKGGRLTDTVDANDVITHYEYDAANRVVKKIVDVTGDLKLTTTYQFDAMGRQIQVTEGQGTEAETSTQYIYDRKGQIKQIVIDPKNKLDANGNPVVNSLGLDLVTTFTYDAVGHTTLVEKGTLASPSQQVTLYTFDKLGRKTSEVVDPGSSKLNLTTQYKYDPQGNLTRVIDAKGNSTWYMYNLDNQKIRQIDALGGVTTFNYDKNAVLQQKRQLATPVDVASLAGYDVVPANFALPALDNANDRRTFTIYDNDNRLKYTLSAMNADEWVLSENVYDANNNVKELRAYAKTVPDSVVNNLSGSIGANERSAITVAEIQTELLQPGYSSNVRVTKYEYDANNRQIKTTLPGWYDVSLGRVFATQSEADPIYYQDPTSDRYQRTIEVTYDKAGREVRNSIATGPNASDRIDQYKTYDAAGREVYSVDGLGFATKSEYDALGNILKVIRYGATGTDVGLTVSELGSPSGLYWTTTEINTKLNSIVGRVMDYTYDKAGRKLTATQPLPSQAVNYVARPASDTSTTPTYTLYSAAAKTTFEYDATGNLVKESHLIDNTILAGGKPNTADTYYYYDAAGRRDLTVDPEGYVTRIEYDVLGNVSTTTEYATAISTASITTSTRPNPLTNNQKDRKTVNTYDALGHIRTVSRNIIRPDVDAYLAQVDEKKYNTFGEVSESYDAVRAVTKMEYNKLGAIAKVIENSRLASTDSSVDVFTSQAYTNPVTEFKYDAFGQSTTQTRYASSDNGVTAASQFGAAIVISHTYDHAGNEIKTTDPRGKVINMKYDYAGHMIAQSQLVSVADVNAEMNYSYTIERRFEYDAAGRQVAVLDLINNGAKVSGQYNRFNGFGEVLEEYKVWGSSTQTAKSLMGSSSSRVLVNKYNYNKAGNVIAKHSADGHTFYNYDLLGNVTRQVQREADTYTEGATDRVTETLYDKNGRVLVQHLPKFKSTATFTLGDSILTDKVPVVSQVVDRWGNRTSLTNAAGVTTTAQYNQNNQLIRETGPFVSTINYNRGFLWSQQIHTLDYDLNGHQTLDQLKAVNSYGTVLGTHYNRTEYDMAGQVTRVSQAYGSTAQVVTSYTYDFRGNRVGTRDGIGHVTVDKFNENNQVVGHYLIRNPFGAEYTGAATGSLVETKLASYRYDDAGRKYAEGDALDYFAYNKYDERDNLVQTRNRASLAATESGYHSYIYDELGNKTLEAVHKSTTTTSGYGNTTTTTTVGEDLELSSWTYDYAKPYQSSMMQTRTVAGITYTYSYNDFGQLKQERGTSGGVVDYGYLANGMQESITETVTLNFADTSHGGNTDGATAHSTTETNASLFKYDINGNRTSETNSNSRVTTGYSVFWAEYGSTMSPTMRSRTVSPENSSASLTTNYRYDELSRLVQVTAPRFSSTNITDLTNLQYDYDEWGNRRRIMTTYRLSDNTGDTNKEEWYSYDDANRVVIEAGKYGGSAPIVGIGGGTRYGYDAAGRRISEEKWYQSVASTLKQRGSGDPGIILPAYEQYSTKINKYNDLGLVKEETTTTKNLVAGSNLDGPLLNNPEVTTGWSLYDWAYYDDRGFKTSFSSGNRVMTLTYRANGALDSQTVNWGSVSGTKESESKNYVYDTLGNIKSYTYYGFGSSSYTNTYNYEYTTTYAGLQVSRITVDSSQPRTATGATINSYDARGRLIEARINESNPNDGGDVGQSYKTFNYNASGQITHKIETKYKGTGAKTQDYYYTNNGGELANFGTASGVDISPLSSSYSGGSTPGSYTVNSGDTLMSIAQSMFGDSKLWYLIADANGLVQGPTDSFKTADIGRSLRIPNSEQNVGNTSTNYKPYNASEKIGDLTPSPDVLPPPKAKGCNAFAIILMVVVAVVLTVVTAGAAAAAMGATSGGLFSTGMAAISGSLATTGVVAAGSFAATAGLAVSGAIAAAAGGFIGSIGSQLVGKGMGVVDHFSLRQAVGSGLTAGFASGAGAYFSTLGTNSILTATKTLESGQTVVTGLNTAGNMARGAVSYLGAYASNKVAGLETHFNWTDMAVATVSSSIMGSKAVGDVTGKIGSFAGDLGAGFAGNFMGSALSSSLSRLTGRGQKQNWGAMAADAFGNALANFAVKEMAAPRKEKSPAEVVNKSELGFKELLAKQLGIPIDQLQDASYPNESIGSPYDLSSKDDYINMINTARAGNKIDPLSSNEANIAYDNYLKHSENIKSLDALASEREALKIELNKQSLVADTWDDVVDFFGGKQSLEHRISTVENKLYQKAFDVEHFNASFANQITGDVDFLIGLEKIKVEDQGKIGKSFIDSFSSSIEYADNAKGFLVNVHSQAEAVAKYAGYAKSGLDYLGISNKFLSSSLAIIGNGAKGIASLTNRLLKPLNFVFDNAAKVESGYNSLKGLVTPFAQAHTWDEMKQHGDPTTRALLDMGMESEAAQRFHAVSKYQDFSNGMYNVGEKGSDAAMKHPAAKILQKL